MIDKLFKLAGNKLFQVFFYIFVVIIIVLVGLRNVAGWGI